MGTSFEAIDYENLKLRSIYDDILCDMSKKEFEIDYQYDLMYKIVCDKIDSQEEMVRELSEEVKYGNS